VTVKGKYTPYEITSLALVVLKMSLNTRQESEVVNFWEVVLFDAEGLLFRLLWYGEHVLESFYDNNCSAFKLRNKN